MQGRHGRRTVCKGRLAHTSCTADDRRCHVRGCNPMGLGRAIGAPMISHVIFAVNVRQHVGPFFFDKACAGEMPRVWR